MKFNEKKQVMDHLLDLISKGRAGNSNELSIKLGISTRTVRRCIEELRDQGHPIHYIGGCNGFYLFNDESPQF